MTESPPSGTVILPMHPCVQRQFRVQADGTAGAEATDPANSLFRRVLVLVVAFMWSCLPLAAEGAPLTSLHAIRALNQVQVTRGITVAFEATVTYYNPRDVDLFVQDGGDAIYVETQPGQHLLPGDRVLVRGRTRKSFSVDIIGESVSLLHHGAVPSPVPTDFEHLIRAEMDCRWVSVRARIRSADIVNFGRGHAIYLRLLTEGGIIDATVLGSPPELDQLLDSEVQIDGVVSGKFDSKMQLVGILLEVPSLANLEVLKHSPRAIDALSITPMADVLSASYSNDRTRRVRVRGTITYYQPGSAAVLQNGAMSLWISTHASYPMRIGDAAEATGFPDARDGFLKLLDGEIRDTNEFDPVQPAAASWRQLSTWNSGDPDGHQSDLVSFEGEVVASVRSGSQDEFVLVSNHRLFSAVFRHPPGNIAIPPMRQIPTGTRVRVTGICMVEQASSIDPTQQELPFNILLRSFDDIAVVGKPSVLNVRNLILVAAFLLLLLIAAGVRAWITERRIRRQNAHLAYLERRRGRILENINGSQALAEIITDITEMVCLNLPGAHCWCQIRDGAQLGNRPLQIERYRVMSEEIAARSGPPHGTMYAGFDPSAKPKAESEILSRASALASLAIETRRLYSDLVRRSDFDMLTEVHNRFSLEKYLDHQIEESRETAGIFGLLYIDLNDFKQVNDTHGHKVGDIYLQEIATRVKRQLRAPDMLARIGGDEFAVVLPNVRNRAEIDEVAHRIERCIEGAFFVEGCRILGSASVGVAVYPEDGDTRDTMLRAADAAMYVNKQIRRETR